MIGLSVGGAKDIGNFRQKIRENIKPDPSDITYEGIFYEYYFQTSGAPLPPSESDKLFAPTYSTASCCHPLTADFEQYISVGLRSNLRIEDVKRPSMDIIVLLEYVIFLYFF